MENYKIQKSQIQKFNYSKIEYSKIFMYWDLKILDFLKFLNN